MLSLSRSCFLGERLFVVLLRVVAGILFAVWLVLLLMGKGGFIHLLLLNAVGVAFVEFIVVLRTRMAE